MPQKNQHTPSSSQTRKLAAILFADIVGYTALMQQDEVNASTLLRRFQSEIESTVNQFNGQIVNFYGDGALCIFQNPLEAMQASIQLQKTFNADPKVPVRMGLHSGMVVVEGGKIYGDSVNISSRIESMGIAGSILLSKKTRDEIKNQKEFELTSLGNFEFKNVEEPMEIFALSNPGFSVPDPKQMVGKLKGRSISTNKPERNKWLGISVIVLLLMFAGIYFFGKFGEAQATAHITKADLGKSIGILPFNNMSGESTLDYFSNGIREEIATSLVAIKGMDVYSNMALNTYKDSKKSPLEIGEESNLEHLLIGNIRLGDGAQKVVDTRLLHVPSGKILWAKAFRENEVPVASFQTEIAQMVSVSLQVELTVEQQQWLNTSPTQNDKAYNLYLRAMEYAVQNARAARKGITLLEEAIALDPTFADAHAGLSTLYWMLAENVAEPPVPYWLKSKEFVQKALDLDPQNWKALNSLGVIQHNFDWDLDAAERSLLKGLELNPKSRRYYIVVLIKNRKTKEAVQQAKLGMALNPELEKSYGLFLASSYVENNQLDEAKQTIEQLQLDSLKGMLPHRVLNGYYLNRGEYKKALAEAEKIKELNYAVGLALLSFIHAKMGNTQEAQHLLETMQQMADSMYIPPTLIAEAHFGLGQTDQGFKELYRAYQMHDWILTLMNSNVFGYYLKSYRNDPRYLELLKLVGLPVEEKG